MLYKLFFRLFILFSFFFLTACAKNQDSFSSLENQSIQSTDFVTLQNNLAPSFSNFIDSSLSFLSYNKLVTLEPSKDKKFNSNDHWYKMTCSSAIYTPNCADFIRISNDENRYLSIYDINILTNYEGLKIELSKNNLVLSINFYTDLKGAILKYNFNEYASVNSLSSYLHTEDSTTFKLTFDYLELKCTQGPNSAHCEIQNEDQNFIYKTHNNVIVSGTINFNTNYLQTKYTSKSFGPANYSGKFKTKDYINKNDEFIVYSKNGYGQNVRKYYNFNFEILKIYEDNKLINSYKTEGDLYEETRFNSDGSATIFYYNSNDTIVKRETTNLDGTKSIYLYSDSGKLTYYLTSYEDGSSYEKIYNTEELISKTTIITSSGEKKVTDYEYDKEGDLFKETRFYSDGSSTIIYSNSNDTIVKEEITNLDGTKSTHLYSDSGKRTYYLASYEDGGSDEEIYNSEELLSKATRITSSGEKKVTDYTYDEDNNRIKTIQSIEGNITTNEYDYYPNGNVSKRVITYPDNSTEEFKLNESGLETQYISIESSGVKRITNYTYDEDNNRIKIIQSIDGDITTNEYDYYPNGEMSRRRLTRPDNSSQESQFNESGFKTQYISIDSSGVKRITNYTYDEDNNRIKTIQSIDGNITTNEYDYYPNGKVSKHFIAYPDNSTEEFKFNESGLTTQFTRKYPDGILETFNYKYHENKNMKQKTITFRTGDTITIKYDMNGNRI